MLLLPVVLRLRLRLGTRSISPSNITQVVAVLVPLQRRHVLAVPSASMIEYGIVILWDMTTYMMSLSSASNFARLYTVNTHAVLSRLLRFRDLRILLWLLRRPCFWFALLQIARTYWRFEARAAKGSWTTTSFPRPVLALA